MKKNELARYSLILIIIFFLSFSLKIFFHTRKLRKINNSEVSFQFFVWQISKNCTFQTTQGYSFTIKKCEQLQVGEKYTIVGRAKTMIDNKTIYYKNIDLSNFYLDKTDKNSYFVIFWQKYNLFEEKVKWLREEIITLLSMFFSAEKAQILTALFLGTRAFELSPDWKEKISQVGMSHMMAVSGFHLNVVFNVLNGGLLLFFQKNIVKWLLFPMLFFYVLLVGTPLSVVRAILMLVFSLLGRSFFYKQVNSIYVLFICFLIMTSKMWLYAYDIGFQLSCLATMGILLFADEFSELDLIKQRQKMTIANLQETKKSKKWWSIFFDSIKCLIFVSFAAQLMTLPLIINNFGDYAVFSVLATLIFSPLITIMVIGTTVLTMATLCLGIKGWSYQLLIRPLVFFLDVFSEGFLMLFNWYINNFSLMYKFEIPLEKWQIVCYYGALISIALWLKRKKVKRNVCLV